MNGEELAGGDDAKWEARKKADAEHVPVLTPELVEEKDSVSFVRFVKQETLRSWCLAASFVVVTGPCK